MEVPNNILLTRHMFKDRWCDVKVTENQKWKHSKVSASCKIFVARLPESITSEDRKKYFETFGAVADIYIPQPFCALAFVTFRERRAAHPLFGKEQVIIGTS